MCTSEGKLQLPGREGVDSGRWNPEGAGSEPGLETRVPPASPGARDPPQLERQPR